MAIAKNSSMWKINLNILFRAINKRRCSYEEEFFINTWGYKYRWKTGAVNIPIYQTSTYKQRSFGENSGYEYSRTGNPTRESLEKLIADIEYGKRGFAFASGLAAITAVLSLFKSGDKLLITNNLYGGTFRVIDKIFSNFGIGYEIIDDFTNIEEKLTIVLKLFI